MTNELSEGWIRARISDAAVDGVQTGFACGTHNRIAKGIAHLRPMNVNEEGKIDLGDLKFIPSSEVDREERWVRSGDVLFNNTNSPELVGKTAYYGESESRAFSNHMTRLRCRPELVDARFCAIALHQLWREGHFEAICNNHVSQASVSRAVLLNTEIALPPLAEQRRIVQKVNTLLEQLNRAKARLDRVPLILRRLREAVLVAACTGELTADWRRDRAWLQGPELPDSAKRSRNRRRGANLSGDEGLLVDDDMPALPDGWIYARLDRLTTPDTVITYGIVLPGPEVAGGVPYVRQQDIVDGQVLVHQLRHTSPEIARKHERSELRSGDVLLSIIRNLRVAIVPPGTDGANLTQGTVRIRPHNQLLLPAYLAAYLQSSIAQNWLKRRYFGMDMPRVNVEDARALPVALPSLSEQHEIVNRVQRFLNLIDVSARRVAVATAHADRLVEAILAKAFSGELVPTEAELARAEGRSYETAEELLERVRARCGTPEQQPATRRPLLSRRRRTSAVRR